MSQKIKAHAPSFCKLYCDIIVDLTLARAIRQGNFALQKRLLPNVTKLMQIRPTYGNKTRDVASDLNQP